MAALIGFVLSEFEFEFFLLGLICAAMTYPFMASLVDDNDPVRFGCGYTFAGSRTRMIVWRLMPYSLASSDTLTPARRDSRTAAC
jgi:hypothetical protein